METKRHLGCTSCADQNGARRFRRYPASGSNSSPSQDADSPGLPRLQEARKNKMQKTRREDWKTKVLKMHFANPVGGDNWRLAESLRIGPDVKHEPLPARPTRPNQNKSLPSPSPYSMTPKNQKASKQLFPPPSAAPLSPQGTKKRQLHPIGLLVKRRLRRLQLFPASGAPSFPEFRARPGCWRRRAPGPRPPRWRRSRPSWPAPPC